MRAAKTSVFHRQDTRSDGFRAYPPEINSGRIYTGPGSGPLLAAATAWDGLAFELHRRRPRQAVIVGAKAGPWSGPSSASMAAAAAPYVAWLSTPPRGPSRPPPRPGRRRLPRGGVRATVPPPVIAANRSLLMALVATNFFGQNTPAIAATEAHYAEMWAQDAAAMYGYAGPSASATTLTPFAPPHQTTDPAGGRAGGRGRPGHRRAAATHKASSECPTNVLRGAQRIQSAATAPPAAAGPPVPVTALGVFSALSESSRSQ